MQQRFGRFLGARPQDLFLRCNVTEALNEIIRTPHWGKPPPQTKFW